MLGQADLQLLSSCDEVRFGHLSAPETVGVAQGGFEALRELSCRKVGLGRHRDEGPGTSSVLGPGLVPPKGGKTGVNQRLSWQFRDALLVPLAWETLGAYLQGSRLPPKLPPKLPRKMLLSQAQHGLVADAQTQKVREA